MNTLRTWQAVLTVFEGQHIALRGNGCRVQGCSFGGGKHSKGQRGMDPKSSFEVSYLIARPSNLYLEIKRY